jgi:hypothetical protein
MIKKKDYHFLKTIKQNIARNLRLFSVITHILLINLLINNYKLLYL